MKTTNQTTKRFPDGFRMILYIAAVAMLGFFKCYIVKAEDPENDTHYANSLEAALYVEAESEIKLEDWMLNFNDDFLVELEEEEVVLEDWMLDPDYFNVPDYLIVDEEEELELEDWMLNPGYYVVEPLFMAENDQ